LGYGKKIHEGFAIMKTKPPYTYLEFCTSLINQEVSIRTFSDFKYTKGKRPMDISPAELVEKKTLMIRHDVDHYPELAHEMACVEASLGIRSTYFILTTDGASKWWADEKLRKDYLGLIVEMQNMGHEIGLHYDLMGDYFCKGIPPEENLENILKEFRNVGLKIVGCASHGSSKMREALGISGSDPYPAEYINYRIWRECGYDKAELCAGERALNIPALSLEDYGLRYEAYHVTRHLYFSDSGGTFWCKSGNNSFSHPYEALPVMEEGEVMQVLIHPIWWEGSFR
jgi:hypothetical protein